MGRPNRPKRGQPNRAEPEELNVSLVRLGARKIELKRGVEYTVQASIGANAEEDKTWVCPNCHLDISKGLSHIVAWDSVRGVETRRHFHNACWKSYQGVLH
jgi:hypothetical protein